MLKCRPRTKPHKVIPACSASSIARLDGATGAIDASFTRPVGLSHAGLSLSKLGNTLFVGGKFALGLYLGHSNPGEAFGAAGALALMLVWIYYSSMIVLLGAEFTQVWAEERGRGIIPERGAVRVVRETRRLAESH